MDARYGVRSVELTGPKYLRITRNLVAHPADSPLHTLFVHTRSCPQRYPGRTDLVSPQSVRLLVEELTTPHEARNDVSPLMIHETRYLRNLFVSAESWMSLPDSSL